MITADGIYKPRKRRRSKHFEKLAKVDQNLIHCVAVIGPGYKSPLYWYEVASNNNGKMDSATYIAVYKRVFKDIEKHYGSRDFVLWEDGDGSHTSKASCDWKRENGYTALINAPKCPETNPIEDRASLLVVKNYIKRYGHATIKEVRDLAEEGWARVKTEAIARVYDDMPQRWIDIKNVNGRRINR